MENPVTAAAAAAHSNGLIAAREAFLDDEKSLTVYRADGTGHRRISGNLNDRLARAIEAYKARQL